MGKSNHLYLAFALFLLSFSNVQGTVNFQDTEHSCGIVSNTNVFFHLADSYSFFSRASQSGEMMQTPLVSLQQFRFSNHNHWRPSVLFKHIRIRVANRITADHTIHYHYLPVRYANGFYLHLLKKIII